MQGEEGGEKVSDIINIGPECFAAADSSVISWRGVNYVPQAGGDQLLGFDVNEFESTTVYGIFNDPDDPDLAMLDEHLRPLVLEVPVYEDESLARVVRHARLMNEDRARMTPPRHPVVVMTWTILRTPRRKLEEW